MSLMPPATLTADKWHTNPGSLDDIHCPNHGTTADNNMHCRVQKLPFKTTNATLPVNYW